MSKFSVRGPRSARAALCTTTAIGSAILLAQATPAQAQEAAQTTVPAQTVPTYQQTQNGTNSPKGPKGKDAILFGDHDNDGGAGSVGGAAFGYNIAFAPGVTVTGQSGQVSTSLVSNGGRGGDGGDAGGISLGGFADGGAAGAGAAGGTLILEQRGQQGTTSSITGADRGAVLLQAVGGAGGTGGNPANRGKGGQGGLGGNGGALTFTQQANAAVVSSQAGVTAVQLTSVGGRGGNSPSASTNTDEAVAHTGGAGGSGGTITATISGSIASAGSGVVGTSTGGNGGNGGDASGGTGARGGDGGLGAGGQDVTLTVAEGGSVSATGAAAIGTGSSISQGGGTITFSAPTAAVQAVISAGVGGNGGSGSGGFGKGSGGNGGSVGTDQNAHVNNRGGSVSTSGYASAGLVAQNLGGFGGNGSFGGGVFVASGGQGATGGVAGTSHVETSNGSVTTTGDDSAAMFAQSVGGGGGRGAGSKVAGILVGVSIGGNGGIGGDADTATVYNGIPNSDFSEYTQGSIVHTTGSSSHAMFGQSIGGGGGTGGDADALAAGGVLSVGIGGVGGTGGNGGVYNAATGRYFGATVENGGVVQTEGDDSFGMIGQSVGGGGGDGGAANSFVIGAQITAAVAVGGSGGTGGHGGEVSVGNDGQVVTNGAGSFGMVAQSVGGGGGTGGTSFSRTLQVYNDQEFPSVDLNASIGGNGGTGGVAGNVGVANEGAVLTSGSGAYAILAQSVGGGGGTGGDADALNQSFQSSNINATTAVGGKGGSGGNAGTVFVENNGLINTAGNEATAIYAQAVGGGGGNGGYGHADTGSFEENETSIQMTVTVGGAGGAGGDGNTVTVNNGVTGIITYGDKSNGIFAQSVGGGGGDGGGAVSKGGGGENNINVAVGGNSGRDQHNNVIKGGGDGKEVNVTNNALILTGGSDSAAIYAQSIGGGGGRAGSATVGNGTPPQLTLADNLAEGFGIGEDVIELGNGLYELREKGGAAWADITKAKNAFNHFTQQERDHGTPTEDGEAEEGSQINVNIGGGVAGTGGAGGSGGTITLTNTGYIETSGPASEGIFAQSVGGGGGDGGGASSANGTAVISGSFGIGGTGGASGNGGTVNVTNNGSIVTAGDLSHAIFAQSIGAGGGTGGASSGESGAFSLLSFNMGGDGGANGNGGTVTVTDTGGVIQTDGDDAIGIVAQSIGGGGGLAAAMEENEDAESNGGEAESETGLIPDSTLIPITLSGSDSGSTSGDGGVVTFNLTGTNITTQGRDSYGILAQSIGGGGGLVLGVDGEADQNFFGNTNVSGNGGNVTLNVHANTKIETHGDGAAGILAQSIGGAGGLVGGLSSVDLGSATRIQDKSSLHHGTAGDVTVNMDADSGISIITNGRRAHGIVAQAAGGGGGIFGLQGDGGTTEVGYYSASGSSPNTGKVTVNANGLIQARGADSWGIWAQSRGNANSVVEINFVDGVISGTAGGIYIENPTSTNSIFADGYLSGTNGVAISTNGSGTLNAGRSGGGIVTITGDILSSGGGWNITNNTSNRIYTGRDGRTTIQSNAFANHGELWVGTSANRTMEITSNLNTDGRIIIGANFHTGNSDQLIVDGTATVGGQILINPLVLANGAGSVNVVVADGLALNNPQAFNFIHNSDNSLTPVTPTLYRYTVGQMSLGSKQVLQVDMDARLSTSELTLGSFNDNQDDVSDYLQDLWDAADSGGAQQLTTLLLQVDSGDEYRTALDSLGPHMLGVGAASRGQADRMFTNSLMSCPGFDGGSVTPLEESCFWGRAGGGQMDTQSNDQATGFNTNSYTFQVGGQKEFGDGWFIGASLAYENINSESDGEPAFIKGDSILAGISVKRQSGPFIASAAITAGLGWFDSSRTITIGSDVSTATASPDSSHVGGHVKLSYDLAAGDLYIRPQVALDATAVDIDSYTEEGSPFAMQVENNNDWILSAAPALEIGSRLPNGAGIFRPYVRGGAVFYDDRDWTVRARLAGTSGELAPFRAHTALPETAAQVGLGMEIVSGAGLEFRVEYSGEFAKDFNSHNGFARLGYRF